MKTVLITGGARGIGRATGAELARRGWTPVLADVDAADDVIAMDVLDAAACERAVETVLERHGRLDAVWANAGIASFGPLALTDPEAWERAADRPAPSRLIRRPQGRQLFEARRCGQQRNGCAGSYGLPPGLSLSG